MIEEMKSLVLALETELTKFEGGNKSAGTRARKLCQDIKAKAQDIRVDIQDKKTAE